MNHEFKYTLIENESDYKSFILKEIDESDELTELLRLLDKTISVQYYKGLFYESDEYDEIISSKINEIIDASDEFISEYDKKEIKYILKMILEYHDIFIDAIDEYISDLDESEYNLNIKAYYINSLIDLDELYLDEISSDYIDEIIAYKDKYELIDYIKQLIDECYLIGNNFNFKTKSYDSLVLNYFNYDEFISDSDEYIKIKYNSSYAYIENRNILF